MKKKIMAITLSVLCLTLILPTSVFATDFPITADVVNQSDKSLTLTVGDEPKTVQVSFSPALTAGQEMKISCNQPAVQVEKLNNTAFKITAVQAGKASVCFYAWGDQTMLSSYCWVHVTVNAPTYGVTCSVAKGEGTVTVDKTTAAAGDTVAITATPANGYKLKSLSAMTDSGPVDVSADGTFTMPDKAVQVYAQFEETSVDPETTAAGPSIVKATAGKTSAKFTWSKVAGAKYYKVLFSKCGKSKCKAIKKTTATSFTKKGLKAKTSYKAYILAYNAKGKQIAKSKVIHIMTKGGNYSNATKVTAKKTLAITAGKTAKLGAKIAKKDSKKKLVNHCAALRYYSADKTIAKVSKKGVVTGVKAGTTYVYAVAPSGVSAKCKVTVKTEMVTLTFVATSDGITFSDDKGKLTAQNTISVPKGCEVKSHEMPYLVNIFVNEEVYTTVTATGSGWMQWGESTDTEALTTDKTIQIGAISPF